MQSAEYNHNDFSGSTDADKALAVKFFLKERKDNDRTMAEGRPIYKEVEYVDIRGAGKAHAMACRPATHADKQRFPKHYAAFKQRIEMPVEGTPLSEWPQISRSQIEEFAFLNIKTVEQMIAMADSDAMKFHGGLNLKRKAAEWLDAADETKLIAEKQMLQDDVSALKAQVTALIAAADAAPEPEKAGHEELAETPEPVVVEENETHDPIEDVPLKKRRSRRAASKG